MIARVDSSLLQNVLDCLECSWQSVRIVINLLKLFRVGYYRLEHVLNYIQLLDFSIRTQTLYFVYLSQKYSEYSLNLSV